jgi:hypothetical protein
MHSISIVVIMVFINYLTVSGRNIHADSQVVNKSSKSLNKTVFFNFICV